MVWFPAEAGELSLPQIIQTGSGTCSTPSSNDTRGTCPRDRAPRALRWPLTSIRGSSAEVKNDRSYAWTLPICLHEVHKGNITLPWLLHICCFGPWASLHHPKRMLWVACEATVDDNQSGLQQWHLFCHFGTIPPTRTPSFVQYSSFHFEPTSFWGFYTLWP